MATVNSARSNYRDVASMPEAVTARLLALANIEVHVLTPGADPAINASHVNIFGSRNPADLAPLPQPIVTDATGIINFWAEPGEYDIFIHDRNAPARIADQRFGWSSLSPVDKGIPAGKIRDDAALDLAALSAVIMRQITPLGGVIDWWRPTSTYDAGAGAGNPPPGYAVCDGSTILAANHDFGTGGSIVLPDLRNKFVLGADITRADGVIGPIIADGSGPAPGIRGAGGAHSWNQSAAQMPSHGHTGSGGGHTHSALNTLAFLVDSGALTNYYLPAGTGAGAERQIGQSNTTASGSGSVTINNTGSGVAINNVPAYVGLLKIMKVRRS